MTKSISVSHTYLDKTKIHITANASIKCKPETRWNVSDNFSWHAFIVGWQRFPI